MFRDLHASEVLAAGQRLRGRIRRTPLRRSGALSALAGGDVFLKLENEQITGSFKARGALNVIATLDDGARARGVMASSAGNHGLGVAWAAQAYGIKATIFVPASAPRVKREGIAAFGAAVDSTQPHYDAAFAAATAAAAHAGATFINPCAGERLLAGQGTVGLEILEELPTLATLVASVGGGGLIGGCASLLRRAAPWTEIVGAQSTETNAMAISLEAGRVLPIEDRPTLAEGLAGGIDEEALEIGRAAIDRMALVSEAQIADAIGWLWREEGVRAEGAGAASVAALLGGASWVRTPVAVIVSGGNIDAPRFDEIVEAGRGQ